MTAPLAVPSSSRARLRSWRSHLAAPALLAGVSAAGFTLLSARYASRSEAPLDRRLHAIAAPQVATHPLVARWWVELGGPHHAPLILAGILSLALLLLALPRAFTHSPHSRLAASLRTAFQCAAVLAGAGGLAAFTVEQVWKPYFHRMIGTYFAFPSGHAAAAATCGVLAWGVARALPGRWLPRLLGPLALAGALVLIVLEDFTLVGFGYHYATDTLAGSCWGAFIAALACMLLPRPVAAGSVPPAPALEPAPNSSVDPALAQPE